MSPPLNVNGLCDWLLWPGVWGRNDRVPFSGPRLHETDSFHLSSFGTLVLGETTLHRRNLTILRPPCCKVTQNRHVERPHEKKNTQWISYCSRNGSFGAGYEEAFRWPQHLATSCLQQRTTSKTLPKLLTHKIVSKIKWVLMFGAQKQITQTRTTISFYGMNKLTMTIGKKQTADL